MAALVQSTKKSEPWALGLERSSIRLLDSPLAAITLANFWGCSNKLVLKNLKKKNVIERLLSCILVQVI